MRKASMLIMAICLATKMLFNDSHLHGRRGEAPRNRYCFPDRGNSQAMTLWYRSPLHRN
jgi:hypothetical protein